MGAGIHPCTAGQATRQVQDCVHRGKVHILLSHTKTWASGGPGCAPALMAEVDGSFLSETPVNPCFEPHRGWVWENFPVLHSVSWGLSLLKQ